MEAARSLEGWTPDIGPELPLAEVIELAFDYRGNTTVLRRDGTRIEGYIFNRNAEGPEPFIQLLDTSGEGSVTVLYSEIETIHFTGKDTAAGNSYAAWLRRKAERPNAP